jgi:hypothetical protein
MKNKIHVFNSFEAAKEKEIQDIIKQSPVDRLRQTVELILRAYNVSREDLKNRTATRRIRIILAG